MMNDQEIADYWRAKEEECRSILVVASAARYVGGYAAAPEAVDGLFFIMKNGIYFENFPQDHWLDKVFRGEKTFTKINIQLKNEHIYDVSCFPGQKDKYKLPFKTRLAFFFSLLPRHLLVEYREEGRICLVRFASVKSPISLCAAYYQADRVNVV